MPLQTARLVAEAISQDGLKLDAHELDRAWMNSALIREKSKTKVKP